MKRLWLRKRTLSLRLWLILAVVAITGAGFLAQMGMVAPVSALEQQAEDARLANARQTIGTDAAQWRDPTWRRRADASFAALNMEVALFPAQSEPSAPPGQAIYATS